MTHVPAYIVALVDVGDRTNYQGYGDAWNYRSSREDYGGELLVVADEPGEVIEGEWSPRLVVMKFPDADKARARCDSPEYRDVRKIRWAWAADDMALYSGFDLEAR